MDGSSINQGIGASSGTTQGVHTARVQVEAARIRRRELIASGRLSAEEPPLKLPENVFRGYTVQGEIHRGGQGVVYQALQQSTNRKVAIKVLLDGAHASNSSRLRFEREIELVAGLRHPNVISVFHSDVTADGLRYCVMDFVRGLPITRYVRQHDLTLPEVLRLFMQVCDAVNHAHQKGVIHRDLKPSNILVDGDGTPRVLDFGLAKGLGEAHESLVSMTGQVVGTLPYMSPEQTRGNGDEIDIRTDVYALGVLLYELLTGRYPYPVSGPMADVLTHIAETEPVPPGRYGLDAPLAAWQPRKSSRIDDDLQTIVIKTLAKERERRYQSAGELARDIGHFLAGEPIEARRDSVSYVLHKQLRRHRMAVGVCTAFVGLLIAGFAISLRFAYRADRAAVDSEAHRQRAESFSAFLTEVLTLADPAKTKGEKLTVREALDHAAKRIEDGALRDQPLVEAEVRFTIGSTYLSLVLYDLAAAQYRIADAIQTRELGEDHPDTLRTRSKLTGILFLKRDYAGTALHMEPILRAQSRLLGPDNPDTLRSMSLLGFALVMSDRYSEGEPMLRKAVEGFRRVLGKNHKETARHINRLGDAYIFSSYPEKAEPLHREALLINTQLSGENDAATLYSLHCLASALHNQNRHQEAEPLYRKALEISRVVQGPQHPDTVALQGDLARVFSRLGRHAEAESMHRECLAAQLAASDNAGAITTRRFLAECLARQGKNAEAESLLKEALNAAVEKYGPEHGDTSIRLMCALSDVLAEQRKDAEAEQVARQVLEIQYRQQPRPNPAELDQSSSALIEVLLRRQANDEAAQVESRLREFKAESEQVSGKLKK